MFAIKIKEQIENIVSVYTKSVSEILENTIVLNSGTFMYAKEVDYNEGEKTVDLHLPNNTVLFSIPTEKILIQDKDEIDRSLANQMNTEKADKVRAAKAQSNLSNNHIDPATNKRKRKGCGCSRKRGE